MTDISTADEPDLPGYGRARPRSATATLSGTGLLADDLYLMAHDDVTGRSFLHPRALSLGLAGGLLAELLVPGKLGIWQGWVVGLDAAGPGDVLGQRLLGHVLTERERHPVRDWLAFLARSSTADVAVRLERAGYLACARARRPWRGERWIPVNPDCAFATLGRARAALETSGSPTIHSAALAGLAVACGLGPRLLPYAPPDARRRLDQITCPLVPAVRELIAQTQAAVDSALLTHWA